MDIISKKGNMSSDNTNLFLDHVSPWQSPTAILIRKSPNSCSFLLHSYFIPFFHSRNEKAGMAHFLKIQDFGRGIPGFRRNLAGISGGQ